MGITFFDASLKRMINGRSVRRNQQNITEAGNRAAGVDVARPGNGLIEITFHHQARSLRANVIQLHQEILANLPLQAKTPLLRISRAEPAVEGHRSGKRDKAATRRKRIVQGQEIRRTSEEKTELKIRRIKVQSFVFNQGPAIVIDAVTRTDQ